VTGLPGAAAGRGRFDLVAIGGSAGALELLFPLLQALPATWPLPIAVVVHFPRDAPGALPPVLRAAAALPVVEAEDKLPLAPGTIHLSRPGYHLLVGPGPALALAVDAPEHHSMPAIDVLFESAAATFGPRLAALLLSGANEDGARGLAAVHAGGGLAAVVAPEDARVDVMPRAALRACPQARPVPARDLSAFLLSLLPPGIT
jgi:two-component system chemotaxis response regulator CheB